MGKPAEDETPATRKPVLDLPKVEGLYDVTFTDGSTTQSFYNPVTGFWSVTADGQPKIGAANRISVDGGEDKLISVWAPVTPVAVDQPATP